MRVVHRQIEVETRRRIDIMDVTELVKEEIRDISPSEGVLHIFVPHTTVGLALNENESGLIRDIESLLEKLVPELGAYEHNRIDNNAHAHLRNILISSHVTIPISSGNLVLGTWQRILLIEGDGPRNRILILTYIGL